MSKELLIRIKDNGLKIYKNIIPKHIVCSNCGLERSLNIWLKEHGNNCKQTKLDSNKMT